MFQRYYKREKVITLRIYYNSLKMRKINWSKKTYRKLIDLVNLIRRKRVGLSWYNYSV